jgi:hypothetical protein
VGTVAAVGYAAGGVGAALLLARRSIVAVLLTAAVAGEVALVAGARFRARNET